MNVICLEEKAFYTLIEEVVERVLEKSGKQIPDRWIDEKDAMKILGIKSKTTLQKLRDEGQIGFSQPFKKVIRYDRQSIELYLEKYTRKTF